MPTLAAVFDLTLKAGNESVRFNIETKIKPSEPDQTPDPEIFARTVLDVVRRAKMADRVTIQSFDWRTLQAVRHQAPDIITVYLSAQQRWLDNIQRDQPGASPWTAGFDVDDYAGSVARLVHAAGGKVWSPYHKEIDAARFARGARVGSSGRGLDGERSGTHGYADRPWCRRDHYRLSRPAARRHAAARHGTAATDTGIAVALTPNRASRRADRHSRVRMRCWFAPGCG